MGKGRPRQSGKRSGPLQSYLDREAAQEALAPLVNGFTAQHGDYERNMRFVINRGGTALDRWKKQNMLSLPQESAILHVQGLWRQIERGERLVANLDRTVFGSSGDNTLEWEARDSLHRITDYFPRAYWDVFENVCRFDEPAGVAGSRIASDSRSASAAARTIVCMIADTIYMRERLSY